MQDFGEMVCLPMKNKPYLIAIFMLICLAGCVTPTLMPTPTPEAVASATPSPVPPTLSPTQDEKLKLVKEIQFDVVEHVAWSPDSTAIVMSGQLGERGDVIAFYQLNSEGPKWVVDANRRSALTFTPDGKYIVYFPPYGVLTFLDIATGEIAYTIEPGEQCNQNQGSYANAIFIDKNKIYTAGTNYNEKTPPYPCDVRVWDTETATCELILSTNGIITSASLNYNDYLLINLEGVEDVDGDWVSGIQVINPQSNIPPCSMTSLDYQRGILNPTRNEMIVENKDGLELWNVETCTLKQKFPDLKVWTHTFDPEGRVLVAQFDKEELIFWDLDTETIFYHSPVPASTWFVTFDPSGTYLLTLSASSPENLRPTILRIWQV